MNIYMSEQQERVYERYSTLCDNDFSTYNNDVIAYLAHDEGLTTHDVLLMIQKERKKIHEKQK